MVSSSFASFNRDGKQEHLEQDFWNSSILQLSTLHKAFSASLLLCFRERRIIWINAVHAYHRQENGDITPHDDTTSKPSHCFGPSTRTLFYSNQAASRHLHGVPTVCCTMRDTALDMPMCGCMFILHHVSLTLSLNA